MLVSSCIMKSIFISSLILIALSSECQTWLQKMQTSENVFEAKQEFDTYWENKTIEKGTGYKPFMRWYNFWAPRTFPSGEISEVNPSDGIEQHLNLQDSKSLLKSPTSPWTVMGPYISNGGYDGIGRLNTIAFHPTDPNTWFVGTPGGGLWKTTNGGSSWTPLTDFLTNLGISDIAISSSNPNTIYIATGDRDARDTYSFGILKSIDGGNTWNYTGLSSIVQNRWTTNRILINPSNENILIVATGDGIYRSTNAGASFTQVQTGGHFICMEFNPANPNIVYSGQYDYWNEQATFYKSLDNGQNWSPITTGLPTSNCRRIHIGVTPANSNYVYLIASDNNNGMEGFYRSTDAGSSFSLMASSPNVLHNGDGTGTNGQGWYDLSLAVSPTNANEVYVGGVNMWKSTNGGSNLTKMTHWYNDGTTVIHADQHWFSFHNGGLFVCNDGGLYVSYDGANSFNEYSNGLVISQYYRISNDQNTNNKLIAGAQDNGSDLLAGGVWYDVNGGDGMQCLIDYTDPNVVFSATQFGNIYRSNDGGYNYTNVSPDPGNGAWITPYEMDPTNHMIMYCGYYDMHKSTDNGISWTQTTSGLSTGLLRHIQISKTNGNVIYCSSYDQLFKSTDGGNNFTDVTGTLPVGSASISSICIDPTDENSVWITFSGYSAGEKVFRTDDGAFSWTNQSGTLPNLPVNILIYQNGAGGLLYAGTDVGVYWWDPNNSVWDIYGINLPNVIISDLDIQYGQSVLRAATYGRGVWEIPITTASPPIADFSASPAAICEGDDVFFTNNSFQADDYLWTFPGGTPSTSTDINPSVTYNTPGFHNVVLIANNINGSDTLEISNYIEVEGNLLGTITVGNASNVYTNMANHTESVVVDNDINTVIFLHRQNTNEFSGTVGMYRYDYSTDDGQTWSLNNGVLNPSAAGGTNDGRYPQVGIHNPSGNTNPSNASLFYHGPTIGTTWNGYVSGDGLIGSGSFSENYNEGFPTNTYIPGSLTKGAPGVYWTLDGLYDGTNLTGLQLLKGTWNSSNVVWSVQQTFTPNFNTDIDGAPSIGWNSFNVAFDPTGQNGWIVFLSHLNGTISNYQYYPIFYQTTDGGNTWSGPIEIDLSTFPSITSNITGGGVVSTAFDIDLVVDVNGNPHTLFNVCSGGNTNYSIFTNEWMGACHLHHNGLNWEADILEDIQTLRYTLADGSSMDNTPNISLSDTGNIMAFSWTDSDSFLTGGDNSLPFLNIVSYNSVTDVYSALATADICSLDPGKIVFLHCANNLLETSQGYEIAAVISDINPSGSGLDETGHIYFSYPIPSLCSASGTDVQTACDNYTWINGQTYTTNNNSATWTLISSQGCDSLVTLDLTITNSNSGTDIQTACDTYTWINGQTYTANNNSATWTLTNAQGCDSLVTLDLTITNSNSDTDIQTACDTYTWINGQTYTVNNNSATWTLTNAQGCDSLVTLDLTMSYSSAGSETVVACNNYNWSANGQTFNQTGQYTAIITNSLGCDSTATLNLSIVEINITSHPMDQAVNVGNDATFDFTDNLTIASYQWQMDDGSGYSNLSNTGQFSGTDTKTLTVSAVTIGNNNSNYRCILTDSSSCMDTTDVAILTVSSGNSINEYDNTTVKIYPNPTNGWVTLSLSNTKIGQVILTDVLGKEVLIKNFTSNLVELDLNKLNAKGTYFAKVLNADGNIIAIKKLIHQ